MATEYTNTHAVGILYDGQGQEICTISFASNIKKVIKDEEVIINIVPSEQKDGLPNLMIQSLKKNDNKLECINAAQQAHFEKIEMVTSEIEKVTKQIQAITASVEERVGQTSGEKSVEEEYNCLSILPKLYRDQITLKHKLKDLQNTTELEVDYKISTGGITATCKPGLMTYISFLSATVVWIPYTLSAEVDADVEIKKVKIPLQGIKILGTESRIVNNDKIKRSLNFLLLNGWKTENRGISCEMQFLYDGRPDWTAKSFGNKVRGEGNILTIIESSEGYIFGAFVSEKYGTCNGNWFKGSEDNFLFSFGKRGEEVFPPVKLVCNGVGKNLHFSNCGLHMGKSGSDLIAFYCPVNLQAVNFNIVVPGFSDLKSINSATIGGKAGQYTYNVAEVYQLKWE